MGEYLCSREMVKQGIEKGIIKNWGDLFVKTMDTQSMKKLKLTL
jgi:hypothetical protein